MTPNNLRSDQSGRRRRMPRWLMWSGLVAGSLLALLTLLLHSLPGLALMLASDWYARQGEGYSLSVQRWDFVPLKTRLELTGVELQHPDAGTGSSTLKQLVVQFSLADVRQRRLRVDQILLDGARLHLSIEAQGDGMQAQIAGLSLPLQDATAEEQIPDSQADASAGSDQSASPWLFTLRQLRLSNHTLSWNIALPAMHSEGQLTLTDWQVGTIDSESDAPVPVMLAMQLQGLQIQLPAPSPLPESLPDGRDGFRDWLSVQQPLQVRVSGQVADALTQPRWEGDIRLSDLQVLLADAGQFSVADILLSGVQADARQQRIQSLQVTGIELRDQPEQRPDVRLAGIVLRDLEYAGQRGSVQDINVQELQWGVAEQPVLALRHYQLQALEWLTPSPEIDGVRDAEDDDRVTRLSLGAQQYDGLELNIHRQADGRLQGLPDRPAQSGSGSEPAVNDPPTADTVHSLLALLVAGLSQGMPGDGDEPVVSGSQLHLEDRTVTPPLQTTLNLYELQIGAVNIRRDADGIRLQEAIPLHLVMGMDRFNRITLDAELSVFSRADALYPQGNVQLTVRQLDLVPFNGYLAAAMGYQVERGMLDVDARIGIQQGRLSGDMQLLLRNSRFVPVDEATIARVSRQISMPVDTALDLLRDSNGNVRLNVPVSGDLTNPDVGLQDITRQLSRLALQQGALFYLRQSLQPYGAMLSIASYAGDYLFAIRLDALAFAAGSSDLKDDHGPHLQKVAALMQRKNTLEVMACPFVTAAEAETLGDNWPRLARARGDQVKAALESLEPKLAARISVCRPQQGARPEVVLGVN